MQSAEGEHAYELTIEPVQGSAGTVMGITGTAMDITERRLADREIRLLAQTVASTRDAVVIADLTGRLLFANDSYLEMFGYREEEVIGNDISLTGAPLPGTPLREEMARETLAGGWHAEAVGHCKDGTQIPLDVWTSLVRNEPDEPVAMVAIARDISAMKQEERVQTSTYRIAAAVNTTENLQDLYRAIHEIIAELMPARNLYIAVLDEGSDLLRFPYFVDEMDEAPVARRPGQGLTEYVIRTGEPLLASPEVFQDLLDRKQVESLGTPSLDWLGVPLITSGKTIGALVVQSYSPGVRFRNEHRDILMFVSTQIAMAIQRKGIEDARNESQARLQTVFGSLPFDLWVCDTEGRYLMQNPTSIEHWGNQIGKRPSETGLDPETARRLEETNTLGLNIDITDRKTLQQQLLQAQKLESLGTLAGGIAHDFNNLLGIIMGHATLMPEIAGDPPRMSRSVAAIQKAGRRGASLVRQILTFARKADVLFESVSVNEIVTDLARMLEETFPRTVTISLDMAPDLPCIEADRTQIHQMLLNLCVNARDAMTGGGILGIGTSLVTYTDRSGQSPETKDPRERRSSGQNPVEFEDPGTARKPGAPLPPGAYVRLSVTDTGIGMDEQTKRRVFEPFFTTKEIGKGTGLGLSVVYGIMESHRGFISVDSSPGHGTRFSLFFPARSSPPAEAAVTPQSPGRARGGGETLLLVEDEEMLSELLRGALEAAGYTVLVASDGEQAVSMFESLADDIALVITDLGLPRMSGRDVFIRVHAARPQVPVIIATGYMDPEMKSELMALGASTLVQKPYLPDEVANSVREALKRASTGGPPIQ
jgi:PAS domain S-box-containing protein